MSNTNLWSFTNPFLDSKLRYEFSNQYVKGKVLDYNFTSHMAYYGSRILLESNAREIWHYNMSEKNIMCTIRKYDQNGSIDYNLIENAEFTENSFDSLVSFDSLLFAKNRIDTLKTFNYILKSDGLAIISIPNLRLFDYPIYKKLDIEKNYFKEDFFNDLEKYFETELYTLKFKNESDKKLNLGSKIVNEPQLFLLNSVKKPGKFLASKIDKDFNFFDLHLKNKYIKLTDYEKKKLSKQLEIIPSKNKDDSDSLYYIAIVRISKK